MKIIKNSMFFFIIFHICQIFATKFNILNNIVYNSNLLGDKVVCTFDDYPACIYEPTPTYKEITGKKQAIFLLPFTEINSKSKKLIDKFFQEQKAGFVPERTPKNYFISFQEINKPVKGIRIVIVYDPNLIAWEHGSSDIIGFEKGVIFTLHNKKLVQSINERSSPLRWHA